MHCDILIAGAGACGLIAGRELAQKGYLVTILEAAERTGGRIRKAADAGFSFPVEAGAEFIHGNLAVTESLAAEYNLAIEPLEGLFWQTMSDDISKEENFIAEHQKAFIRKLRELSEDMTVDEFLNTFFGDAEFHLLRKSVRAFVSGYDAADPSKASAWALREEWIGEDEKQFRMKGGYDKLIGLIEKDFLSAGGELITSSILKSVNWSGSGINAITSEGKKFNADRLIITVPAGVLLNEHSKAFIKFQPSIESRLEVIRKLGFGGVLKIGLEFTEAFWKKKIVREARGKDLEKLSFIFSDRTVPTWWTQYPQQKNLLTGWIGGPRAKEFSNRGEAKVIDAALHSLSSIFRISEKEIRSRLKHAKVFDWVSNPFSCGAYSYEVVNGGKLKKLVRKPLGGKIYFAGEAWHSGTDGGTVEAALADGFRVAREINP